MSIPSAAPSGYVPSGDGQNSVSFQNVERLELKLDNGDGTFSFDGSALALGASVDVDAGAGLDTLEADFSSLGGMSFAVGPNGKVQLNGSTFSNFESFYLTLGDGADQVKLGAGDDTVFAGGGNDTVDMGAGNNFVLAGEGNDIVTGGSGNDTLYGEGGNNILSGGDGDDSLVSNGVDSVGGGLGYDYWQGDYRSATDNLSFTYDGFSGSVSNGTTLTGIENVAFLGGVGDDAVTISGASITPEGASSVILYSGGGSDTLSVDLADGVAGTDFITVSLEGRSFSGVGGGVSFSDFEEVSFSGEGGDTASLTLFSFDSGVEATVRSDGTLTTNIGVTLYNFDAFYLQLGEGNDAVVGSANFDRISGMGGDDIITGGGGGDQIWGGTGADTFVYNLSDFAEGAVGAIYDFSSEEGDKIDLQNVVEGEFAFVSGGEFSGGGSAELRTEDAGGSFTYVEGDTNGDGVADFTIVVLATGALTESDFLL